MPNPFRRPFSIALAALATTTLGGCYYGDVYGAGYGGGGYGGGYACDNAYYDGDPYAYDDGYGYDCYDASDYGGGFVQIGFGGGWYDDYYYPGYGLWMFDNYRNRYPLRGDYLNYWGGRRAWWRHRGDRNDWHGRDHDGHHDGGPGRPGGSNGHGGWSGGGDHGNDGPHGTRPPGGRPGSDAPGSRPPTADSPVRPGRPGTAQAPHPNPRINAVRPRPQNEILTRPVRGAAVGRPVQQRPSPIAGTAGRPGPVTATPAPRPAPVVARPAPPRPTPVAAPPSHPARAAEAASRPAPPANRGGRPNRVREN